MHWNPQRALLLLKIDLQKIQGIDEEYANFIGLDLNKTLNYEFKLHGVRFVGLNELETLSMSFNEIYN